MTRFYPAEFLRAIDGDTVEMIVDCGFGIYARNKFRLARINAPEMNTPDGPKAKLFVEEWFKKSPKCRIESTKGDKYGRWLAEVFSPNGSLVDDLLQANLAVPYA